MPWLNRGFLRACSYHREYMRRRLPEYQDQLRAAGVIPIDATLPIDQVANVSVSRTAVPRAPLASADPAPECRQHR